MMNVRLLRNGLPNRCAIRRRSGVVLFCRGKLKNDGEESALPAPAGLLFKESNMENMTNKLAMMTMAAALLAGAGLLGTPAKADVAAAEATYKGKCAGCHGADGKGNEAMKTKDLASPEVQKMSDADLTAVIANGKPPKMPPYKSMTPDQIKDMVAYIRSFKK